MCSCICKSTTFVTKENKGFYREIRYLIEMLDHIDDVKVELNMGNHRYTLDDINDTDFHDYLKDLMETLTSFLYRYQKIIPFESSVVLNFFQRKRYFLFKNKFEIKNKKDFKNDIIYKKFIEEAIIAIHNNEDLFLQKILIIYNFLDYSYNHPSSNIIEIEKKMYTKRGKNKFSDGYQDVTLEEILCSLISFEEGLYNAPSHINYWGLYKSSFYNLILYDSLKKIIYELGVISNIIQKDEDDKLRLIV